MRSIHENCNHDLEQLMMVYSHEEAATFDRGAISTRKPRGSGCYICPRVI